MTLDSNSNTLITSTYLRRQQFLIPPSERLRFVILFILLTPLTAALVRQLYIYVFSTTVLAEGILGRVVGEVVGGTIVGSVQWLLLRKYVPSWLWIGATSLGMSLTGATREVLGVVIPLLYRDTFLANQTPIITLLFVGIVLGTFSAIWLSLAQWWLVLRHYVRKAWRWILITLCGFCLGAFLVGLSLIGRDYTQFIYPINLNIIAVSLVPAAQAIGLCAFYKKSVANPDIDLRSPVLNTQEITNRQQVKTLAESLYSQINRDWVAETSSDRELTYLVGVAEDRTLRTYQPVNLAATSYVEQTPLPSLVASSQANSQERLAWFKVSFTPLGAIKIRSLTGISLRLAGLVAAILLVVMSATPAFISSYLDFRRSPIQGQLAKPTHIAHIFKNPFS